MYDPDDIELRARYLDTKTDEYCTVIGRMSSLGALVQYDDGLVWDHNPSLFEDERFVKIPPKPGRAHPAIADACAADAHDFGNTIANDETPEYSPRCDRCGLSLQALREFVGQLPTDYLPWECEDCGRDLPTGDELRAYHDGFVCAVCVAAYTGDYWGLPDYLLEEEFVFECSALDCGWRSESKPETAECPTCGEFATPVHRPQ